MRFLIGFIAMVSTVLSGELVFPSDLTENSNLVIILMGPPGSGKGTHANPLSKRLAIPHISTGDLFRENIRAQTELGQTASSYIRRGQLVPDQVVLDMLFKRIEMPDCSRGYILDGFPRTVAQARALDDKLQKMSCRTVVVNLNIPDSLLVERICGRMACKECSQLYHKTYAPPKEKGICDQCQGSLYQRDDDKEEILAKRLEVYHEQSSPLIEYYGAREDVLKEVPANKPPSEVFESVIEAIPRPAAKTPA